MVNKDLPYTKVFDNLEWFNTASANTASKNNIFNETFTQFRVYNDYQNTGWLLLNYQTATYPQHKFERRDRSYITNIPRNIMDVDFQTNPDIFDVGNYDATQLFKGRIRDKYMIAEFTYNNANDYLFSLSYIITKYRISYR
jgi:hypothetical protein